MNLEKKPQCAGAVWGERDRMEHEKNPKDSSLRHGPLHSNIFQSTPVFHFAIAITIPIENQSGKIGDRFSFVNRSAILISESISDFRFQIDQRLKKDFRAGLTDGTLNRDPISM
jgi:hypothetical protein